MSNAGKKLIRTAREAAGIARRKLLRRRIKLYRLLKGEKPSTEYDWGCDYQVEVRPDHNDTTFITFAEPPSPQKRDEQEIKRRGCRPPA